MFVRAAVTGAASGGIAGLIATWLSRIRTARRSSSAPPPEVPIERVAFLRDVHGLRIDEIATELHLSHTAVERALFLARKRGVTAVGCHRAAARRRSG